MGINERRRRAKEIIAESGADTAEHFRAVEAVNLGVTFKQQAEWFMEHVQIRRRKPIKPATQETWANCVKKWLNSHLGQVPLSSVNNLVLKELVAKMAGAGLSAKSIRNYAQLVKSIVASAVNEQGEELYPRKWNSEFLDLPLIGDQNTPAFTTNESGSIIASAEGQYRVLYALLAGSGLRIGEAAGLEVGDVSADGRIITVKQSVWAGKIQTPKTKNAFREVDLHPTLASLLRTYIGQRTSGMLFCTSTGKPISQTNVLKRSLYPILKKLELDKAGFHAFRRCRITHLREKSVPEDILRFWIGHANTSTTDEYSKLKTNLAFRGKWAVKAGLGFAIPVENPIGKPAVAHEMHEITQRKSQCRLRPKCKGIKEKKWCARRDSNSRPSGS
jgi:integrase